MARVSAELEALEFLHRNGFNPEYLMRWLKVSLQSTSHKTKTIAQVYIKEWKAGLPLGKIA